MKNKPDGKHLQISSQITHCRTWTHINEVLSNFILKEKKMLDIIFCVLKFNSLPAGIHGFTLLSSVAIGTIILGGCAEPITLTVDPMIYILITQIPILFPYIQSYFPIFFQSKWKPIAESKIFTSSSAYLLVQERIKNKINLKLTW